MTETSPLRRRMIEDMTVRNLSPATQRSYVHAVAKFSRFFGRSPDTLTLEDVRTFQVHLASKGVAWASLNQTVAALRFFYDVTLGMAETPERIAYAREPRRLPVVLSAHEVVWPAAPEREHRPARRLLPKLVLRQRREARDTFPHVGRAAGQIDPHAGPRPDHAVSRSRTSRTSAASPIPSGHRNCRPLRSTTVISPAIPPGSVTTAASGATAISTGRNTAASAAGHSPFRRISPRHW